MTASRPGRTRIKVCGMTRLADALGAVAAGVDALGFIFAAKSPRRIAPDQAREIIAELPPFVATVGVFVDEKSQRVEEIVRYCGLTVVQLHGGESPAYCASMPCRVVKVFSLPGAPDFVAYQDVVSGFLVDTFHDKLAGGTGQAFDWSILDKVQPPGPLILAGGLGPHNVAEAVRQVRPFAVDVNSGVESAPGLKDIAKIKQVVAEVRRADHMKRAGT